MPRTALPTVHASSFAAELRKGWVEFRSRTWLWVASVHFCLFNILVWAPSLVLGPVIAQQRLGGATSWGLVMALYGLGAVDGGVAMLGRSPHRPLIVATAATLGFSLPSAALATGRPLPWICAAAFVAGIGSAVCGLRSAVCGTLYTTTKQRQVPQETAKRPTPNPQHDTPSSPAARVTTAPRICAHSLTDP
ncbi:hypothetical protein ACFVYE_25035 [Streptomyces sp. NPDC058239]|uniref:hypothetical protein n=1 Tax=Streptomyces sp. NPDC058239 TaxID=3346395 RepID=UPI0036E0B40D